MNILNKSIGLVGLLLLVFICQMRVNLFANELQGKWTRGGILGVERNGYSVVFAEKSETNGLTGKWRRGGLGAKLVEVNVTNKIQHQTVIAYVVIVLKVKTNFSILGNK